MVCALHVMKLLLCVHPSRTGFLVLVELEDSTLSSCFQESAFRVFSCHHLRIFDWILAWVSPHRFPRARMTPSFFIGFFLALNGLCNTRFVGFDFAIIAEFIGFGFAIGEP